MLLWKIVNIYLKIACEYLWLITSFLSSSFHESSVSLVETLNCFILPQFIFIYSLGRINFSPFFALYFLQMECLVFGSFTMTCIFNSSWRKLHVQPEESLICCFMNFFKKILIICQKTGYTDNDLLILFDDLETFSSSYRWKKYFYSIFYQFFLMKLQFYINWILFYIFLSLNFSLIITSFYIFLLNSKHIYWTYISLSWFSEEYNLWIFTITIIINLIIIFLVTDIYFLSNL